MNIYKGFNETREIFINPELFRMKEVLDKVRLEYRDDYEKFINKMERETDEVSVVVVLLKVVLVVMVVLVLLLVM